MYLPSDERRLLAGLYRELGDVGKSESYKLYRLGPLLRFMNRTKIYKTSDVEPKDSNEEFDKRKFEKFVKRHFDESRRVEKALKILASRKYIEYSPHTHDQEVVSVSLTLDGYDLGRRYSSLLGRSGLWFEEYRNHWIWLLVAFLGGGFASRMLDYILKLYIK